MAKHLKHLKTGELKRVSKTEANAMYLTGEWKYIDRDTYRRKMEDDNHARVADVRDNH